jgi:hypothetical protein
MGDREGPSVRGQATRGGERDTTVPELVEQNQQPAFPGERGGSIVGRQPIQRRPVGPPHPAQVGPDPVRCLAYGLTGGQVVAPRRETVEVAAGCQPGQQVGGQQPALDSDGDECGSVGHARLPSVCGRYT